MRSQLVGPVLARVRAAGADAVSLARRFGLPAGAETLPEVVLPLARLRELLDAAALATRDDTLGLHLAESFPRGGYGVVEYACRTAPTVRAAIATLVRYIGLLNELVTVSFEETRAVGLVEQRIEGEPLCVGRHANEFFVATVLHGVRTLAGGSCVPERVWFAHEAPADTGALVAFLGTPRVRFGAGGNGLALARAVLDRSLASSDPPLHGLLDGQAAAALGGSSPARVTALVRRRLREHLPLAPALEGAAADLGLAPRTLQRRLADEGTSFARVLDELRHELAVEHVQGGHRPLGEIAFLLGYAELSPFLRAFRRWTGRTPGALRGPRGDGA